MRARRKCEYMLMCKVGLAAAVIAMLPPSATAAEIAVKKAGVFMPPPLVAKARTNASKYPWAADMRDKAVREAEPWMKMSDDKLWGAMFGATIPRSWMVWSDGFCPECKASVPMYNWRSDPFAHPWKVQCPHCGKFFPTNDFGAYYKSGLDEHGVFDPKLADRSLLFNTQHPDANDPLHLFGVDDGTGYVDADGHKWRFIGCYLIYGQWKQMIVAGVTRLATAYAVTGDPAYAHKAGILLDRVADLYPTFDYASQGEVYERHDANGYVTVWHDACIEVRELAMGYDIVFDAIKNDDALVRFLATKAKRWKLDNPKSTFADIQRNIEDRILRDTVANRHKIQSNVPQTDITITIIKTILGWPENRAEVEGLLDKVIGYATAVDGLVGEKGMTGYAATGPNTMGPLLGMYSRVMPGFLDKTIKRCPRILDGYRFYFDMWCLQQYYPNIGDASTMAAPSGYRGIGFSKSPGINPSMFSFFYQLYELSGDPAYVQALYLDNGSSVEGLPYDMFADDPEAFQSKVRAVIDRAGTKVAVGCVDKKQWHVAVLRSGEDADARALWLDYDSSGPHSHADCMNLGLFAKGLDLMTDFGYPPVQYGGWNSPKANWFKMTAAHNTVVIDGEWQKPVDGKTTLWIDAPHCKAMRAAAPQPDVPQFERTVAMVDVSPQDAYILDVFRVVGKGDHAKMQHTQAAKLSTEGLALAPAEDFGHGAILRNTQTDPSPKPGWSADFDITDRRNRSRNDPDVHVRIIDLTNDAEVSSCEEWVSLGITSNAETWIPKTIVRRRGTPPLASTFVSVIEPYDRTRPVASVRRLPLETPSGEAYGDANVAVEVKLADGRRDVLITADVENPLGSQPSLARDRVLVQKETGIELAGEFCVVRFDKSGGVETVLACAGGKVRVGGKDCSPQH